MNTLTLSIIVLMAQSSPFLEQHSTTNLPQPSGNFQQEEKNALPELRVSLLTQQGSGLLSQKSHDVDNLVESPPTPTPVVIPNGWFRKTAYAWSVGDYFLLGNQLRTACLKAAPWIAILFAILLSGYLQRRKQSS